jgi:hypothetical protein
MARGKLRIRQRGSRQQWAHARTFKEFAADRPAQGDGSEASGPSRPLAAEDIVATTRCGLCGTVVEQRRRDNGRVVVGPYALCLSCDEVRCQACWAVPDDGCVDDEEHEFLEVQFADNGVAATADFANWSPTR